MVANGIQRVRELTAGRYTGIAAAVILLSWLGFAFLPQHGTSHTSAPSAEHMPGMHHANMAPMATPVIHQPALWMAIVSWILMTIAMMGPATLPAVQYVEQNTLRGRRGAMVALYAAIWILVWCVVGVVITLALSTTSHLSRWWLFAAALMLAALWQLTPLKRRALGDCHRSTPLSPRGWPAANGAMRFGAFNGSSCVRSCWAVMLAMAVAPSAHLVWMVVLTAVVTYERFTQRPQQMLRLLGVLLALTAAGVGAFALLQ